MKQSENKKIKRIIIECQNFFEISDTKNIPEPPVYFLFSREEVDQILNTKTEPWVRAFTNEAGLYFIDESVIEKVTSHKKGDYWKVVHHEISHWYFNHLTSTWSGRPSWFTEGLAQHMAKQQNTPPRPTNNTITDKYFDYTDNDVYGWGKIMVDYLINIYGKKKLLKLIHRFHENMTKNEFGEYFFETYGITLEKFEKDIKDSVI